MSLNELFIENKHYSSTLHSYLSSTTFSFCGYCYCIHCGKKALPIHSGNAFDGYMDIGNRCDCDCAINEMAITMAYESGRFNIELKTYSKVPDDILKIVITNMKRFYVNDFSSNRNGNIYKANCDSHDFINENETELKYNLHDKWYKDYPLIMFMKLVNEKLSGLIEEESEYQKSLNDYNQKVLTQFDKVNKK